MTNMPDRLRLPTLLSQVLVAFTIEFDNEAERQISAAGPMIRSNRAPRPHSWKARTFTLRTAA